MCHRAPTAKGQGADTATTRSPFFATPDSSLPSPPLPGVVRPAMPAHMDDPGIGGTPLCAKEPHRELTWRHKGGNLVIEALASMGDAV